MRNAPRWVALLRLQQHVAHDRCGNRRSTAGLDAAVLDDGAADIARRADRSESDKQRVVAVFPRQLILLEDAVVALPLADAPDLRGAGLAAHRKACLHDAGGIGGAALL